MDLDNKMEYCTDNVNALITKYTNEELRRTTEIQSLKNINEQAIFHTQNEIEVYK